jgi:hypothetical protein
MLSLFFMEKSTDFAVIFQVAHLDLAIHQTECLQEHPALALTFVPRTWRFHRFTHEMSEDFVKSGQW